MRGFSHQRDFVHSVQPTVHLDIINTNSVLIPRPVNKTDLHFFDAVFRQIHNIRKFQAAGDRKSTIFPFGKIFRETVSAIFRRDNRIPLQSGQSANEPFYGQIGIVIFRHLLYH